MFKGSSLGHTVHGMLMFTIINLLSMLAACFEWWAIRSDPTCCSPPKHMCDMAALLQWRHACRRVGSFNAMVLGSHEKADAMSTYMHAQANLPSWNCRPCPHSPASDSDFPLQLADLEVICLKCFSLEHAAEQCAGKWNWQLRVPKPKTKDLRDNWGLVHIRQRTVQEHNARL